MSSILNQLPFPPTDKKGWPWTEESSVLPLFMSDGRAWPKISIVTPSYNQGEFIEETIRSVLLQNYPNLEYIIMDGGSTDDSVEIIKKYEKWITFWVSEKDNGQSHAINNGFKNSLGDIFNWLCSDDILLESALEHVALNLDLKNSRWLIGGAYQLDERSKCLKKKEIPHSFNIQNFLFWRSMAVAQPSIFWNKKLQGVSNVLREDLHYSMDIDLWFKFYNVIDPIICTSYLSRERRHFSGKTTTYSSTYNEFMQEISHWMINNLYHSNNEKIKREVLSGIISMQEKLMVLNNLKSHVFFGNLFFLWKKIINKDFVI